jgi:GNAT superfamily N-acetyltransferase/RimJ/RimL family protein N-acetyltransferase
LTITELRADDPADVEASYGIERAALAHDVPDFPPPCRYRHPKHLRRDFPGRQATRALGRLDGVPVGYLEVELTIYDNLDNADISVVVHPDQRRHGVGRALFTYGCDVARTAGRKRALAMTSGPLPGGVPRDEAGAAFATAMGMHAALGDVRRRLEVAAIDRAEHDRLLDEGWAKAAGYSMVQWEGAVPEEYIEDIARLDSSFLAETPLGDLELEPEKVDAARIRDVEATRRHYGSRDYNTGLRHDATGRIVAWTNVNFRKTIPWHGNQAITLVDPRHRGRRLGIIAKIENLRFVLEQEPDLRVIDTWNAAINEHMIAINEAMGFRAVDAFTSWQMNL